MGVKAIDDYTLEVELEAPTAYFLELTAFPTYAPLRKDIIEKYGDKWTLSPESYIGNGPYIMSERNIDKNIVMTKSTNYWNADTIIADKITFMFMQDGAAAIAGIKEGSLHLAYEPPQQDIPTLTEEGLIQIKPLIATYYYPINVTNEYLVGNIKTTKTGAELRIISIEKPTEDAVAVEKNLEDAFLFYFGEKSEEKQDA